MSAIATDADTTKEDGATGSDSTVTPTAGSGTSSSGSVTTAPTSDKASTSTATVEKHWGDPTRSQVREDTTRSERIAALVWISFGAAISCILEILYARATLTLAGHTYIFPASIIAAGVFNYILGRTAILWRRTMGYALVPLIIWGAIFIAAVAWPYIPGLRGTQWIYSDVWTALLLLAGATGGMIPTMQAIANPEPKQARA